MGPDPKNSPAMSEEEVTETEAPDVQTTSIYRLLYYYYWMAVAGIYSG